jgi:predicted PurR-regulated permease PerM
MAGDDTQRLSELTVADARRIIVYGVAVVLAVALFALLIGKVLVALLLGVVAGVYLLPVQEWLERHLHARSGSALITMAVIVIPLCILVGYAWNELSGYANYVNKRQPEIIEAISRAVEQYIPVSRQGLRTGLQTAFGEAVTRSAQAVQEFRQRAPLLLASAAIFFFTVFYVLTQRQRIAAYIKVRVPGEYQPLYDKLGENVGGALRGALQAVFIDQTLKALLVLVLNIIFGVPLAVVLAITTFLIGFFPLLGEWAVYIPISIYLLAFRHDPTAATIYLIAGLLMTLGSSLLLRPRLAARGSGAGGFNFYWMLVALVAGVYTFGIPGIVLGPAILGFIKAVFDTLLGNIKYETSLLKSDREQQADTDLKRLHPARGSGD